MSAPTAVSDQLQWFATASSPAFAHAVIAGVAQCHRPANGWIAADPDATRCSRCVVATSDDLITCQDLLRVGITYRQCDYWVRRGYLRCSRPARGSGSQRLFAHEEVEVAALMASLVAAGLAPDAAARAARTGRLAPGITIHFEEAS